MKKDRVGVPMERVCLDLLRPFPESRNKNKYMLSIVDQFTRWVELFPIRNMEALTVAKVFVNEFVSRYGFSRQIQTDQGDNLNLYSLKRSVDYYTLIRKEVLVFIPIEVGFKRDSTVL